jgi:uncharacterized membrane protein YeaQ/YmgE (transglycosylase-associated protein family)
MLNLLAWIILGGVVGWLASVIMGRREQGCITDIIVGILGAFVGGLIMNLVQGEGLQFSGDLSLDLGSILVALLGAVVLLAVLRALR